MIHDDGEVLLALADRDLVEPQLRQVTEQVTAGRRLRADALQIRPTVRHAIRNSWQIAAFEVLTASHAAVSSNERVNPASCRAHGTAATTTPCCWHSTRGAQPSRRHNVVPRSSARHPGVL